MRWFNCGVLALLVVFGLVLLMNWLIRPPHDAPQLKRTLEGIEVVQVQEEEPSPEEQLSADSAPPPPPEAPPSLATDAPTISVPTLTAAPIDAGPVTLPTGLASSALNLGSSGSFGGFAGRGAGSGAGYGQGKGFKGKPLIPLSTARPQMPDWACKQGIRGWVEVVFTVMPNGRVTDIKLIDADPKGVFEAAAVDSISHWIYAQTERAMEVKQRVPMDPEDCAFNWR